MKVNIHRSADNRIFAGVLGRLAEHYGWNASHVRIIYLLLSITPIFPGILVYLILWLLMGEPINYSKKRKTIN